LALYMLLSGSTCSRSRRIRPYSSASGTYSDTSVIETHLEIYRRDGRLWSPDFLASLDIRHGDWATRADLAIPELRRRFRIRGVDVALRQPPAASYGELFDLLRQLDRGAVTWKRKLPRQVDTAKLDSTGASGLGRNVSGGTWPRLSWGRSVL